MLAGLGGGKPRAKWSPDRDGIRALALKRGARHTSGDRSPARNAAAGGVPNSAHLTTRTDVYADDYVGPDLNGLAAAIRAKFPGVEVLVHDAGSGPHVHVEGKASAAPSSAPTAAPSGPGGDGNTTVGLGDDIAGKFGDIKGALVGVVEETFVYWVKAVLLLGGLGLVVYGLIRATGTDKAAGTIAGVLPIGRAAKAVT